MKTSMTAWLNSARKVCTTILAVRCLILHLFIIAYIRCGNESGQCIRVIDQCNGIKDCLNGRDEDLNTCFSVKEQSFFVERSKRVLIILAMQVDKLYNLSQTIRST